MKHKKHEGGSSRGEQEQEQEQDIWVGERTERVEHPAPAAVENMQMRCLGVLSDKFKKTRDWVGAIDTS